MEYPYRINELTGTKLMGWCIAFRVWVYASDGSKIPEPYLRMFLNSAVQHHQIYGRLWDQRGGLGPRDAHREYSLAPEFGGSWDYAEHTRDWVDNS